MKKLLLFFLILVSITSKGQIISLINDSGVVKTLNPFTGVKTRLNTSIPIPTGGNLKWALRANALGTYDLYDQTKDTVLKVLSNSRFYFLHDNILNSDYIESYDARFSKVDSVNILSKQGGIYTPIITNITDVTNSSITPATFFKVDSIVNIAGEFTILTATGNNTAATIIISLPFAGGFTQPYQLVGSSICINGNDLSFLPIVRADITTGKMKIIVKPTTIPQTYNYRAQYRIVTGGL